MAKAKPAPTSYNPPPPGPLDQRTRDIIGVALFFVSVAGFYCLYIQNPPEILKALRQNLQMLAGWGAFIFPLLVAFVAMLLLKGHRRFSFSLTSIGFGLIF